MCVHRKLNKFGRAMLLSTAGIMVAGFIVSSLHAQSFDLSQNGKSVGTASLSLKPMAGGFDSTSGALVSMTGLNYSFSATANVDTAYQLKNVQLTGSVNGTKATVSSQPEGQQMMVNINANGNVTRTPLAFHPLTVFLPITSAPPPPWRER